MASLLRGAKTYGFSSNSILWSYPFRPGRSKVSLAKKNRQLMVMRATLLAISHFILTRIQSIKQPDVFFSVFKRVKPRILPVNKPHLRNWSRTLSEACCEEFTHKGSLFYIVKIFSIRFKYSGAISECLYIVHIYGSFTALSY